MEHSDARCRVSQWVERRPTTRRGAPRPALTPERRIATLAEEPATLRGDDVTSVKLDVREAKQFIGGEWVDAAGGGDVRGPRSLHRRRRRARARRRRARTRSRAIEAAAAAFPAWSQRLPAERQAIFLKAADILESRAATRSSRCSRARPAPASASGCSRCSFVPGLFRQAAAVGVRADRPDHPVGQSRRRSRWAFASRSASSARSRRGTPR